MANRACVPRVRRLLVLTLAAMAMVGWSKDDYERGLTAYEREDYGQAIAIWRPMAEQGHSEAQFV